LVLLKLNNSDMLHLPRLRSIVSYAYDWHKHTIKLHVIQL